MTIYFVRQCRNHTFPESRNCPTRYMGEKLHASVQTEYETCGFCFHHDDG
jgi:hypothetical protein